MMPIFSGAPAAGAAPEIPAWAANATTAAVARLFAKNFRNISMKPLPVVRHAAEKSARRARSLDGLNLSLPSAEEMAGFPQDVHEYMPWLCAVFAARAMSLRSSGVMLDSAGRTSQIYLSKCV